MSLALVSSGEFATPVWDSQWTVDGSINHPKFAPTTGEVGRFLGTVNVSNCAASICTSPTYALNGGTILAIDPRCGPTWGNADIRLTGWQWNRADGTPNVLENLTVGVRKTSYDSSTKVLAFVVDVGASMSATSFGENDFVVAFEIIGVAGGSATSIVSTNWTCSSSQWECSATNVIPRAVPRTQVFTGFAISKFSITTETGAARGPTS